MKFNIILFSLCFSLICVSVFAQEELSKEVTFQLLTSYQQQFQNNPDVGHIAKVNLLKSQGVDVEAFSRSLLNHEEFIDFRTDP